MVKKLGLIFFFIPFGFLSNGQPGNCVFKPPQFTIHFGTGNVSDPNVSSLYNYRRVSHYCPSDGYYSFASYTSSCFNDDWHTITADHTPGDANGNMLLVNAGREGSVFLKTPITGLKNNTMYQLGVWLLNLCKPTDKCPFPLLPNLNIRLETPEGSLVASIATGDVLRFPEPRWTHYIANFTTNASASSLFLVMTDKRPSGCGNDFAVDDITFRECVKQVTQPVTRPTTPVKQTATPKAAPRKITTPPQKKTEAVQVIKPKTDTTSKSISIRQSQRIVTPAPPVLKTRENALARRIETEAGEVKIDLYDNGQIDGDTVSIYHNNMLIRSRQRLSQKPISFTIGVDPSQSHHEIIMVAENLGSIPPNTSVMIITTPNKRYEVFISSSEQKNAKVVLDLKK
jgi:hypothetical protein